MKFMARSLSVPVITAALCFALAVSSSARAQTLDPFNSDGTLWKSFDRYKEEEKNRTFSNITGNLEADAKTAAAKAAEEERAYENAQELKSPLVSGTDENGALQITPPSMDSAGIAVPAKPLVPPVMPSLVNGGYDVRVGSTEEDIKPAARLVDLDSEPNLQLQKQNWLDAAKAAHDHAAGPGSGRSHPAACADEFPTRT